MSRTPQLAEVIREAMNARLADVHTAIPAEVVSYDSTTQTVDVQPLVMRVLRDLDENTELPESLPQIPNVPVCFPRAGNNWITFPIAQGDTVLLVFCESAIGNWRARNAESDPGALIRHDLTDAIAIPGVYASARALTTSATACVFNADTELHLGQLNPPEFVALATKVLNELTAIRTAFNSHIHTSAAAGSPTTSPTIPMAAPGSVAASKVKAL